MNFHSTPSLNAYTGIIIKEHVKTKAIKNTIKDYLPDFFKILANYIKNITTNKAIKNTIKMVRS